MKKTDITTIILFVLIVGFSFLTLPANKVIGQSSSSSSGTNPSFCVTCALPLCSSEQVLSMPLDSCAECPKCVDTSSCTVDNDCPKGICPDDFEYQNFNCLNGICNQLQFFADPCLTHYTLNKSFTGIWKARFFRQLASSRIITLKLCVRSGKLEGLIHQGGVINNGSIISQDIVSENEVIVTIQDKNGRTETLDLKLLSEKSLSGLFADGKTFKARKINSFLRCKPTLSSSSSSGDCIVCAQVIPECLPNQIVVNQTCNQCPHCKDVHSSSSSSSGYSSSSSSGDLDFSSSSSSGNLDVSSSSSSGFISSSSSSSSSSGIVIREGSCQECSNCNSECPAGQVCFTNTSPTTCNYLSWNEVGKDAFPGGRSPTIFVFKDKLWTIGLEGVFFSSDGINWSMGVLPIRNFGGGHTTVIFNEMIWFIGGSISSNTGDTTSKKVFFSNDGVRWTEAGSDVLPIPLSRHSSLVFDNKIWVFGGFNFTNKGIRPSDLASQKVFFSSDGIKWEEAGNNSLPIPLVNHTSFVFDNKMWIIGGRSNPFYPPFSSKVFSSVDGINWVEASNLPGETWSNSSLVYDNKIFVFGGVRASDPYIISKTVYFSCNGVNWTKLENNLPFYIASSNSAVEYNNKVWIAGGSVYRTGTYGGKKLISSFLQCSIPPETPNYNYCFRGPCTGMSINECPEGSSCEDLKCYPTCPLDHIPDYQCVQGDCYLPICLSPDTRIRTNGIQKRIADIKEGDLVISDNEKSVKVTKTSTVEVKNHKILKVKFNDGTILEISPGHPTSDGRLFKDLKIGDIVDKRLIVELKLVPYKYKYTYDILPDSESGNYYANGILVGSTLKKL